MKPARVVVATLASIVGLMGLVACGGGSSPTGPSTPPVASGPTPTPTPTPTPEPTPTPAPTPPPNTVLRTATIRGYNGHACVGSARILRENNQYILELGDDFKVNGGVNEVFLSTSDDPGRNDLRLGNLSSRSGRQRYTMPDDGSKYANLLIWCRPYTVTICFGEMR